MAIRLERETTAVSSIEVVCRLSDVIIATSALILLAPVMVLIGLLIKLTSRGPVLFVQPRVGLGRKPFQFYKFRTMRVGGDDSVHRAHMASELRGETTSVNGSWKLHDDPRITRVGALLRKTSLDELPQLFNVLRGDMALVGPRPCLEWEAEMFPREFDSRFSVLPGLTGLWQVSGRSKLNTVDMLRLDAQYAASKSLFGDWAILLRTIPVLVRGDGAR